MAAEPVRLEVVAGRAEGTSILIEDELVIGRQADGVGRLADDDEISRAHARVTLDASGFCAIEDLGSTNGTFVNGLRISAPQTLLDGDTIELGGTTLVVRGVAQTPADDVQALAHDAATSPPEPDAAAQPAAEAAEPPTLYERPSPEPDATIIPEATPRGLPEVPAEPPPGAPVPSAPTEADVAPMADVAPVADAPYALLQLAVDFDARELTITLGPDEQPLRLVYDGERWRPNPTPGA